MTVVGDQLVCNVNFDCGLREEEELNRWMKDGGMGGFTSTDERPVEICPVATVDVRVTDEDHVGKDDEGLGDSNGVEEL